MRKDCLAAADISESVLATIIFLKAMGSKLMTSGEDLILLTANSAPKFGSRIFVPAVSGRQKFCAQN